MNISLQHGNGILKIWSSSMRVFCVCGLVVPGLCDYYPGSYPIIKQTRIILPDTTLLVSNYIDSGASTRVFTGVQTDRITSAIPAEVAIKCISTRDEHLQKKILHEFEVLQALKHHTDLRVPRAFYVSKQWSCGGSHKCQFLVMTKAGPDFSRLITRNTFGIAAASQRGAPGQFELFVAS